MKNIMTKISKKHIFYISSFAFVFLAFVFLYDAIRPFAISFVIAYLFLPLVDKLEKKKISRSISSSIIVITLFVGLISTISILVPFIYTKIANFFQEFIIMGAENVTEYQINKLSKILHTDKNSIANLIEKLKKVASNLNLLESGFIKPKHALKSIIAIIATVVVMPIITFYMLKDWKKMTSTFFSLIPESKRKIWKFLSRRIDRSIFAYLRGQINVCLFFALYYSILLQAFGLNFGFAIGLMVGAMMFVPYIGFFVGCVTSLILAFIQFGIVDQFWIMCVIFTIGQLIDANYTTPKFVGDSVGIHPAIIVFGLFASTSIFGITGAILALPITTAATILIKYTISIYRKTYYFE